ncbi:HK97 gp10 family phage protein [Agrobacterium rubi]|uniref:HK97 gp10 family phage protein n=1 Tax=Agrobacterium rubi TaxID=28099 RepID=UPI0015746235|nr:HK97 gp10 family phage protein [Agrobacterium rubi]NTF07183.1 HK97 gp10 family phage protein [Agrobacterium rubi]NTF19439.1 HK97 gp10 family phage protein [Agrobacterium rubi]NTF26402.1 HK97 gp10 family phage protein [Agrobacterium rubi]
MVFKAKVLGRQELTRRLSALAPNIEKHAATEKKAAGDELAEAIRLKAPTGDTLDYMESIQADVIADRPAQELTGIRATKDPTAVGLFAKFTWRFLEFGTRPHNVAKGGGTVLGKKQVEGSGAIMHPGSAAKPHIFPTYRALKPKIRSRIRNAVNRAIRETRKK